MDQVSRAPKETIEVVGKISCILFHPLTIRLLVDPCNLHASRLQLYKEQNNVPPEPGQSQDFNGEHIGCGEPVPMGFEKRIPWHGPPSFRSRFDSVVLQYPFHCISCNLMSKVGERSAYSRVAPGRVLCRHSHYEFGDIGGSLWSTSSSSSTAVVLLCDQVPLPAQYRVGRHNPGHSSQCLTSELLAAHSKPPPCSDT